MSGEPAVAQPVARARLGLALAGGGFRASLFHLGVLRRLAELDLLRRVEVVSTVSGGSIVGALYVLLLKLELEQAPDGNLSRDEYVALVERLDELLVRGIRRDLRTLLFVNPLGLLSVLLTSDSLGRRMARLYERHLFEPVVRELVASNSRPRWRGWLRPGRLGLSDLYIRPGGRPLGEELTAYNARQLRAGRSVVTALVLNATSLNTGGRFWFSAAEVGDTELGAFRADETAELLDRKALLEEQSEEELAALAAAPCNGLRLTAARDPARTVSLARWWRTAGWRTGGRPRGWEDLFAVAGFPGRLPEGELAPLRRAKLAAWYLREGLGRAGRAVATGGHGAEIHRAHLYEALGELDRDLATQLRRAVADGTQLEADLLDFVLELYWLRTAERVSPRFAGDFARLSLGDAVGASACFPPVFASFTILGLYDDAHVSRLGLTDGGVFDNMGITALLEEGCTQIIASDTGGVFAELAGAPRGRLGLMLRVPDVLMRVAGSFQRLHLAERRRVSRQLARILPELADDAPAAGELAGFLEARRLDGLAYFHIDSPPIEVDAPPPLALEPDRRDLARLRTDLDAFGGVEVAALVNHGYATADRYVRRFLPDLVGAVPADRAPRPPKPAVAGERVARILRAGRSRLFRALKLGAPGAVAGLAALLLGLAAAELALGLSTGIKEIARAWTALAATPLAWLLATPAALAGLVALVGLAAAALAALPRRPRRTLVTRAWGMKANLLWLVGALPALLAAVVASLAGLAWLLLGRPFLRATRVRD